MLVTPLLIAAMLSTAPPPEPKAKEDKSAEEILKYGLWMSLVDGVWSGVITGAWALSARAWDAPYPGGAVNITAGRLLYGTTWAFLIAGESAIAHAIVGDTWTGLSKAALRTNWLVGDHTPGGCIPGGDPYCGFGLGGYSELHARITGGPFPMQYALAGGWIQGRFDGDAQRTIMESTWVQCPVSVRGVLPLELGPIDFEGKLGPGLYWGMHNAHVHPKPGHTEEINASLHEFVPLHYGFGPGAYGAVSITFFGAVALDADADLAAMVLGGSNPDPPRSVEPMRAFRRDGTVLWRRVSMGVATPLLEPLRVSAGYWMAELAPGLMHWPGHRAYMLRIDVPILID